jgi:hypothetical protein
VWEVQDLQLLSHELVPKYEKRRTEREEVSEHSSISFSFSDRNEMKPNANETIGILP